ncbi:hypothetical protein BSLG_010198 [Batrachochytrium salamandrivorans]|nr:hypothetical protein BSLG_010198 [Batrachochytrium salamandrivorans]
MAASFDSSNAIIASLFSAMLLLKRVSKGRVFEAKFSRYWEEPLEGYLQESNSTQLDRLEVAGTCTAATADNDASNDGEDTADGAIVDEGVGVVVPTVDRDGLIAHTALADRGNDALIPNPEPGPELEPEPEPEPERETEPEREPEPEPEPDPEPDPIGKGPVSCPCQLLCLGAGDRVDRVHVGRPDGDDVPAEQVESVASEPLETAGAAAGPAAVLLAALATAGGGFPSNAKGARMMQDHSGCAAAGPNEAAQTED